jgi:hypothetical protein
MLALGDDRVRRDSGSKRKNPVIPKAEKEKSYHSEGRFLA